MCSLIMMGSCFTIVMLEAVNVQQFNLLNTLINIWPLVTFLLPPHLYLLAYFQSRDDFIIFCLITQRYFIWTRWDQPWFFPFTWHFLRRCFIFLSVFKNDQFFKKWLFFPPTLFRKQKYKIGQNWIPYLWKHPSLFLE